MYLPSFELASFDQLPLHRRCAIVWGACQFLTYANEQFLEQYPGTMDFYSLAPRYILKKRPFSLDSWQDIPTTILRRTGDCKDFVCWRAAALHRQGIAQAQPYVTAKEIKDPRGGSPVVVYHVQLLIPSISGPPTIEDPSRILGMPEHVPFDVLAQRLH